MCVVPVEVMVISVPDVERAKDWETPESPFKDVIPDDATESGFHDVPSWT